MDEVNLRPIYFICMEFDDMYEKSIHVMKWNLTHG
jgi:hypothetical protein